MGRDPHWGVSGSSHILGAPVLGSNIRKTSLFCWLERRIGRLWEAWTQLREAGACLFTPETGQRKQVSGLFPTTTPAHTLDELSGHSGLGSSCGTAPYYNKGCLSQRKCTVAGDRGGLDLGQHPNRSGAIVVGACKGDGLGTVQNSE